MDPNELYLALPAAPAALNRSPKTIHDYLYRIGQLAKAHPTADVTDLDHGPAERLLRGMLERQEASSVAIHFRMLRAFCNWTAREEITTKSPMAGMGEPKVTDQPPPVPDDAIRALLKACADVDSDAHRDTAVIRLWLGPGSPRVSEMAGLNVDDLDLRHDQVDRLHAFAKLAELANDLAHSGVDPPQLLQDQPGEPRCVPWPAVPDRALPLPPAARLRRPGLDLLGQVLDCGVDPAPWYSRSRLTTSAARAGSATPPGPVRPRARAPPARPGRRGSDPPWRRTSCPDGSTRSRICSDNSAMVARPPVIAAVWFRSSPTPSATASWMCRCTRARSCRCWSRVARRWQTAMMQTPAVERLPPGGAAPAVASPEPAAPGAVACPDLARWDRRRSRLVGRSARGRLAGGDPRGVLLRAAALPSGSRWGEDHDRGLAGRVGRRRR